MKKLNLLSRAEMKKVMGGLDSMLEEVGGANCAVRCDQDKVGPGSSVSVANCSRDAVSSVCGADADLTKAVCICY
jgi:hypothetical protein